MFFNFSFVQKKQARIRWRCPIDLCFFYLFLLTFSLEIRKVIWFLPIKNAFNEYSGIYIYLSDLFLFFTILSWFILILRNKNLYLSIKSSLFFTYLKKINNTIDLNIFYISLILLFWPLFSIFWSENKIISLYRSAKFFELYLLFLYAALRFFPFCWQYIKKKLILANKQEVSINSKIDKNQFVSRETNSEDFEQEKLILSKIHLFFRAILFGFLFIGLFDHYLWDIWQGQVLFWLTIGIIFGNILHTSNKSSNNSLLKIFNKDIDNQLLTASKTIRDTPVSIIVFLNLFIFIGMLQALIGIFQFIKQSSLGLFWLKESLINEKIAGVAKIIVNHHTLIRSYGLFPHPNIFAGFLFFFIMLTILYKNLFHVKQIKISLNNPMLIKASQKITPYNDQSFLLRNLLRKIFKFVSRETNNKNSKSKLISKSFFINTILTIELLALILSFSKSAIIALLLAISYINVSRETLSTGHKNTLLTKTKYSGFVLSITILSVVSFFILYFLKTDFYSLFIKSLSERSLYFSISKQAISSHPLLGIGEGQFIINAAKAFPQLEIWQYQPVHNIFLLIWSEWGIVGLGLFILFLWKLLHIKLTNKKSINTKFD